MILLHKLPEEVELDFRMRYSDRERVMMFFFQPYEKLSMCHSSLMGYIECKEPTGAITIDVDGKKFLPWRTMDQHGDVAVAINEKYDSWWNFASRMDYVNPIEFENFIDMDVYLISEQSDLRSPRLVFELKFV